MFTDKIPENTKGLLAAISTSLPENAYLAGGTALALHINHRKSFDLDFYVPKEFSTEILLQRLTKNIPDFKLISTSWQTLIGASKDTEISFFYYKYPLIDKLSDYKDIKVSSIADIACMKIEAIVGRGLKRDFFDLYTICQLDGWNLKKVIDLNRKKYNRDDSDMPHILKSLTYFTDAEEMPERAEIVDAEWLIVKKYFSEETRTGL